MAKTYHPKSFKHLYTGQNIGVSFSPNITDILWNWFSEGKYYNYYKGICAADHYYTDTCEHYLQVIQLSTRRILAWVGSETISICGSRTTPYTERIFLKP